MQGTNLHVYDCNIKGFVLTECTKFLLILLIGGRNVENRMLHFFACLMENCLWRITVTLALIQTVFVFEEANISNITITLCLGHDNQELNSWNADKYWLSSASFLAIVHCDQT